MSTTETFKPTEVWTPDSESFEFGEAIESARREMNQKNPDQLIHDLKQQVKRSDNGIVYAVLKGEHPEEYSATDALVMFNPFANTATANMLVRAEFIREVAQKAQIKDANDKYKPVIMLASPGIHGSHLALNGEEKLKIRQGDLGPAAKEFLKAVEAMDYGRIALLGFSQGADLALAGAKRSTQANLDLNKLSIGEPAGVVNRGPLALAADFLGSSGQFQKQITAGDISAQQAALGKSPLSPRRNLDLIRFGAVSFTRNNRTLWSALSKNSFEANIQSILDEGLIDKAVVGYGSKGKVSPAGYMEPSLAKLHKVVSDNRLVSVRVEGKDHSWGDNLPLLAKLYLRALV